MYRYGVMVAAVLLLTPSYAEEPIPIRFSDGDVISAEVINQLFSRINDATTGFRDVSELHGSWLCTTYQQSHWVDSNSSCQPDGPMLLSKEGVMEFDSTTKRFLYSGLGDPRTCYVAASDVYITQGDFDVRGGLLVTDYGIHDARKRGLNSFIWMITNTSPPSGFTACVRQNVPPVPVNDIGTTVSAGDVTVSWEYAGTTIAGFKIQRKSAGGAWADIYFAPVTARKYTDDGVPNGDYWYRVFATNSHGDSISSSEVRVNVQR